MEYCTHWLGNQFCPAFYAKRFHILTQRFNRRTVVLNEGAPRSTPAERLKSYGTRSAVEVGKVRPRELRRNHAEQSFAQAIRRRPGRLTFRRDQFSSSKLARNYTHNFINLPVQGHSGVANFLQDIAPQSS